MIPVTYVCFIAELQNFYMTEERKNKIISNYSDHLLEEEKRYFKSIESTQSKNNLNHEVITGDVQKCFPTPLLT